MKTLGIALQHDAGAAVVEDGKIVAAVNEERLNRKKMYWGLPERSVKEVLRIAGLREGDIESVAIANLTTGTAIVSYEEVWKDRFSSALQFLPEIPLGRLPLSTNAGIKAGRFLMTGVLSRKAGFDACHRFLRSIGIAAETVHVEHHDAHAASAYFTSPWNECLAVTLDAVGDGYCSKVFVCRDGAMREVHHIPFFHSPGYYYGYITHLCGFVAGRHEGKITGLAAHGDPSRTKELLAEEISYDPGRFSFINHGGYLWPEIWRLKKKLAGFSREDMSAGIQTHLEDMVTAYLADAVRKTGLKKIVLSGGVFANVRVNQRIREIEGVEGVWVHPHMGDGGVAAGAALHYDYARTQQFPEPMPSVYLGPDFTAEEIETALKLEQCVYHRSANIEAEIAEKLAAGKVVARFNGRMEYGPRALGNRSILYQATDPTVNDWLNKRLNRTEFMPFAPVLLEEDAEAFLTGYRASDTRAAEFMTITYHVTERCRKEAPATVHIDGTARPQVVKPGVNPSYEKVLREYRKRTNRCVLINTSFNMHEEPIVCTPHDAVRAFKLGHLDYLAIGDFLAENA